MLSGLNSKIFKIIIIVVFLLLKLQYSNAQRLLFVDDYNTKLTFGMRFNPKNRNSNVVWLGATGGLKFSSSVRRLGLNLRLNYFLPFFVRNDSLKSYVNPYYNSYVELTFRIIKYKKYQNTISLGIAKPSDRINPYYGCPYCYLYNITVSIQQQIRKLSIELRFDAPIGDSFGGWNFPRYNSFTFSVGVNYSFSLSKKKEK